jgi:hypothetical protein
MGDESAQHHFLKSLPPHVRGRAKHVRGRAKVACREAVAEPAPDAAPAAVARYGYAAKKGLAARLRYAGRGIWAARKSITARDCREFLMAYCACFIAAMAFII